MAKVLVEENEKVVEVVEEAVAEETVENQETTVEEVKESVWGKAKKIGKKIAVPALCVIAYALGVSSGKKKGGCGSDEPAAIPCNDTESVEITEF